MDHKIRTGRRKRWPTCQWSGSTSPSRMVTCGLGVAAWSRPFLLLRGSERRSVVGLGGEERRREREESEERVASDLDYPRLPNRESNSVPSNASDRIPTPQFGPLAFLIPIGFGDFLIWAIFLGPRSDRAGLSWSRCDANRGASGRSGRRARRRGRGGWGAAAAASQGWRRGGGREWSADAGGRRREARGCGGRRSDAFLSDAGVQRREESVRGALPLVGSDRWGLKIFFSFRSMVLWFFLVFWSPCPICCLIWFLWEFWVSSVSPSSFVSWMWQLASAVLLMVWQFAVMVFSVSFRFLACGWGVFLIDEFWKHMFTMFADLPCFNSFRIFCWFCSHCLQSFLVYQHVLLGAVPFPSDVLRLKALGVCGVVTLNESYERLVPTSLYEVSSISELIDRVHVIVMF